MITLQIKDYKGDTIQQWSWDKDWVIPQKGDILCLPSEDNPEEDEVEVTVLDRYIRIKCPSDIILVTDYVE